MTEYLLLAAGVVCLLLALTFFMITMQYSLHINWNEPADPYRKIHIRIMFCSGIGLIVFGSIAWMLGKYLLVEHPRVLEVFGLWYLVGFVSRLLLLIKRHQVLSHVFATDWEGVWWATLVALLGPLVTLHVIWAIWINQEKNWWEE